MSSKVLYFRGTPLTTLWNPKIQHKLLQFRRLSSKTTNCCSLQPPNVSHLAKTAHISLTPTEVEEFGPKIQQVIGCFHKNVHLGTNSHMWWSSPFVCLGID
ncbi:unnamed protein product [Trifolium pratense]|uniref:Uncharacterized protein n=1 Tax=Trifolium pratense TaxID=57577 RepID=A0ACB0IC10_TRIPR|nr:unnamed protein product [Trifolium pratense]